MTTVRMTNGNCVAALQPAPGDLFVVTLLAGKVVFVQPASDYEKALRLAEAFAARVQPAGSAFTIKVLGMSLAELTAFHGTSTKELSAKLPPESREADWKLVVSACRDALRNSDEAIVRRDAHDLLIEMGVIQDD